MLPRGIFVVAAKRTAFGAFGGKLKSFTPTDLGEIVGKGALASIKLDPKHVDSVIFGNCVQSSSDAIYISRHVGIRVGAPIQSPALTVIRICGTGFQVMVNAAHEMLLDDKEICLVGGAESMSNVPYVLRNARFGTKFGQDQILEDWLWAGLTDPLCQFSMAMTAENLAVKYKISRQDCDSFALRSQQRWKAALDAGKFNDEIVAMQVKGKKGMEEFKVDEHPKPTSTMANLAKLPVVFKKDGVVTAGNASGIVDGAAALVLATEEAVKKHNLSPLARLVGYHYVGCPPEIMGIGPVPAIEGLLKKSGKKMADIDLFDVNEAFAPQFLAVEKALGLDPTKTNVNGGAIALGHPLAATGSRITASLIYELGRRKGKFAVGSACIGGGQGIAVLLENCCN